MDKGSGNQDTGTKVLAEEEDWGWDLHPLDLLCHDWETSTEGGGKEDDEDCSHVQGEVVFGAILLTAANRLLFHGVHFELKSC